MTPEFRLRPARLSCVPCSSRLTSFPVGVVNQQPRSELRHRPGKDPPRGPLSRLLTRRRVQSSHCSGPRGRSHLGPLTPTPGTAYQVVSAPSETRIQTVTFASLPPLPGLIRVVEDVFVLLPSTLSCCPFLLISLTHACFLLSPELSGRTPASERLLLGLPLTQNALSSRRLLGRLPPMLQVFVYISHWK